MSVRTITARALDDDDDDDEERSTWTVLRPTDRQQSTNQQRIWPSLSLGVIFVNEN